jgi:hypothetical protein
MGQTVESNDRKSTVEKQGGRAHATCLPFYEFYAVAIWVRYDSAKAPGRGFGHPWIQRGSLLGHPETIQRLAALGKARTRSRTTLLRNAERLCHVGVR